MCLVLSHPRPLAFLLLLLLSDASYLQLGLLSLAAASCDLHFHLTGMHRLRFTVNDICRDVTNMSSPVRVKCQWKRNVLQFFVFPNHRGAARQDVHI